MQPEGRAVREVAKSAAATQCKSASFAGPMTAAIASGASELVARGVVAHVDLEMGYGILQAGGYGRVLIVSHFDRELVTLGNWLSVRVKQNTSITW
ncbi:unnamed protein product, partial [Gongylonema pulchrum]|uniref:CYTOSOL_AP domain-containing protein n=1 Tax=Gongylonema pulchrum TaxID=637853 RepID=A0A183EPZ7_9BILA